MSDSSWKSRWATVTSAVKRALLAVRDTSRKATERLSRFDPNEDPTVDPMSAISVVALALATAASVWMFVRWKYQPMQDLGHHVALSAVVADYGRPGSLYTSLYEPIDPFAANSLLYQVAGHIGRLVGVTRAVQGCMVFYLVGVPVANAYALRVFGRSIWGALLAVPLCYNMIFLAGFANMLFGAPLMIVAIPLLHTTLRTLSWKRALVTSLVIALLFLAHAHLFMWTGFLLFLLTFAHFVYAFVIGKGIRQRLLGPLKVAGMALGCVVPALLLFAHWYSRTFGEGRTSGTVLNATSGFDNKFGAVFRDSRQMIATLVDTFELTANQDDTNGLLWLLLLVGVAIAIARLSRLRQPPVLELVCIITFCSYFVLPDGLQGHDVLAQRQPAVAMWFLPVFLTPVPWRVSRLLRIGTIAATGALCILLLSTWYHTQLLFQKNEVVGLEAVMSAAPAHQRLHYVKIDPTSRYFTWRPFWHIEKIYMGDKLGQAADTPGILSTSCIRYRSGIDIHRNGNHTHDWSNDPEIWRYFDIVLVRSWRPSAEQRKAAETHGTLLRRAGEWELWKSNEAVPP